MVRLEKVGKTYRTARGEVDALRDAGHFLGRAALLTVPGALLGFAAGSWLAQESGPGIFPVTAKAIGGPAGPPRLVPPRGAPLRGARYIPRHESEWPSVQFLGRAGIEASPRHFGRHRGARGRRSCGADRRPSATTRAAERAGEAAASIRDGVFSYAPAMAAVTKDPAAVPRGE